MKFLKLLLPLIFCGLLHASDDPTNMQAMKEKKDRIQKAIEIHDSEARENNTKFLSTLFGAIPIGIGIAAVAISQMDKSIERKDILKATAFATIISGSTLTFGYIMRQQEISKKFIDSIEKANEEL